MYNIDYNCGNFPSTAGFEAYFNQPAVRHAIHAPQKAFVACNSSLIATLSEELVTPPAYSLMPAILEAGVSIHIYSGDHDFLFNHIGTELMIQNMTW
jgi:carboxypeptidase D